MPSPAANALTRQHRRELAAVTALVTDRVRRTAMQASVGDIDGWWQRILEELVALVAIAWRRARGLSSDYLIEHARIEGVTVDPTLATWVTDQVVTSLRVRGPVLFKTNVGRTGEPTAARATMARTLPAAASRLVLAGERDTVARTVEDSDVIVGWRRVTDADPCAFCALLASRGAVYSQGTVRFEAHDGDECTAEPLYEHEDEPPEVAELYQEWLDATAGTGGKAAIRKWRAYWDAKER